MDVGIFVIISTIVVFVITMIVERSLGTKTQIVRLFDIFIFGPFMIYYGFVTREQMGSLAKLMMIWGLTTIVYNGKNYILNLL